MSFLLFLLVFFSQFQVFAQDTAFEDYETKGEIPEPLYIDLVRNLNSKRGEWEVNSLFYHKDTGFDAFQWAPEIEWVAYSGGAVELEFPMLGDSLYRYKAAFQQKIWGDPQQNDLHGLQLIYEADKAFSESEGTLYYIIAYRWNTSFSTIALVGGRWPLEADHRFSPRWNITLFYNKSDEIDIGLEVNHSSNWHSEAQWTQIIPQLHFALDEGYKIQFGFGAREEFKQWSPVSMFRLIREFNRGP